MIISVTVSVIHPDICLSRSVSLYGANSLFLVCLRDFLSLSLSFCLYHSFSLSLFLAVYIYTREFLSPRTAGQVLDKCVVRPSSSRCQHLSSRWSPSTAHTPPGGRLPHTHTFYSHSVNVFLFFFPPAVRRRKYTSESPAGLNT